MTLDLDLSVIVVTHDGGELALQALRTSRERPATSARNGWSSTAARPDDTPDPIEAAIPTCRSSAAAQRRLRRRQQRSACRGRAAATCSCSTRTWRSARARSRSSWQAMDARPEVGVSSVIQIWPAGGVQQTIRRFPSPGRQLGEALALTRLPGLQACTEEQRDASALRRASMSLRLARRRLPAAAPRRRSTQVGGLDERFFMYSEETDWCYRLRAAGWDVRHLPLMTVAHHTGRMARPDLFAQNSTPSCCSPRKHFPARRGSPSTPRSSCATRCGSRCRPPARAPACPAQPGGRGAPRPERPARARPPAVQSRTMTRREARLHRRHRGGHPALRPPGRG